MDDSPCMFIFFSISFFLFMLYILTFVTEWWYIKYNNEWSYKTIDKWYILIYHLSIKNKAKIREDIINKYYIEKLKFN
jgi:hypothetical protein